MTRTHSPPSVASGMTAAKSRFKKNFFSSIGLVGAPPITQAGNDATHVDVHNSAVVAGSASG